MMTYSKNLLQKYINNNKQDVLASNLHPMIFIFILLIIVNFKFKK